jgi:hypothetical protein
VSPRCDHERVFAAFSSRWSRDRERAIADAYVDPHADELLAQMLDSSKDPIYEKVMLAAHLGDLEGAAGVEALERATEATGPGSRDLRCAALLALAKRCGDRATLRLRAALASRDGVVKDYAVLCLAGAGDDQAWDEVFDRLGPLLRRKNRTSEPSDVEMAFAYLAQHAGNAERRHRLVAFIRAHWATIAEDAWFSRFWPEACPAGLRVDQVAAPSAAPIRAWARDSLFEPLGPPLVFE